MEALVRDTKRKAEREKRLLNVKRFFITLTAAISIFSCTMLPVKAVREAVITTLIEWHDKFVSIIYVNEESPVSTFHITPSYIPSGFSQIESSGESTGHYYGQFQNSAGDWFSLRVFPVENTQTISWDNEFSSYYSISFDSNQAIWGIMDDGSNTLLWESNNLISFFLRLQTVRCFLLTLRGDRRKWPRKFIKALLHTNPVIQPQHGHSFKNSHVFLYNLHSEIPHCVCPASVYMYL